MDDVILVCKDETRWDSKSFQESLTKQCYIPPLCLEPSKEGVFLETEFEIVRNKIVHRLKNDNKDAFNPQIWRYQLALIRLSLKKQQLSFRTFVQKYGNFRQNFCVRSLRASPYPTVPARSVVSSSVPASATLGHQLKLIKIRSTKQLRALASGF